MLLTPTIKGHVNCIDLEEMNIGQALLLHCCEQVAHVLYVLSGSLQSQQDDPNLGLHWVHLDDDLRGIKLLIDLHTHRERDY